MPSYRRILRQPGALRFSSAALIARFPMSMLGISFILTVQEVYGSYSAAGAVSAALVVAQAIGSPLLARQVDARGQAAVMRPALVISAGALAALIACLSTRAPLPAALVLAAVAGAFTGSMGSLARSSCPPHRTSTRPSPWRRRSTRSPSSSGRPWRRR